MLSLPTLNQLVDALPEIYQPIYGHPEFDTRSLRNVEDRLAVLLTIHDALAKSLGRPVRILDLGCAQGWFSLSLAKAGAQVVGLDIIAANINVCNMLVLENRHLQARFKLFEVEKVPESIGEGQFDLVMGLSVLHHLCHHNGKDFVRTFMQNLFTKIPSGLFEFALASEPTELAAAQPDNPEFLIDYLPFYRVLSKHPSHLSSVQRPLYFCSKDFWYLGAGMQKFDDWEDHKNGQRHFHTPKVVVQLLRMDGEYGEANRRVFSQATEGASSEASGSSVVPQLIQAGEAYDTAWLVYEKDEVV